MHHPERHARLAVDGAADGPNLRKPREAVQPVARVGALELTVVRPVESLIEKSSWNSRAWTFQERMLSRRSLIFTQDRVFFQCRASTWSEEIDSESSHKTWTLEKVRSPVQNYSKNPLRLFLDCDALYSSPRLPHASAAFPSWSWCGWEGACTWRMSMVSGILLNLNEWLAELTWVVWYKTSKDGGSGHGRPSRSGSSEGAPSFGLVWRGAHAWPGGLETHKLSRWDGYRLNIAPYGRKTPYRGVLAGAGEEKRPTMPTIEPSSPGTLYFWTWTAHFQLSRKSMTTPAFASKLEPGLHRFGLFDAKGDWCGTVVLENACFDLVGDVFEFAAISEAREFSMEELDTWNYYIPEERDVSEWYLFYALLLKWNENGTIAERMGLAKIYQDAFRSASFPPGTTWKEITLV